jgi:hypothetical protein
VPFFCHNNGINLLAKLFLQHARNVKIRVSQNLPVLALINLDELRETFAVIMPALIGEKKALHHDASDG